MSKSHAPLTKDLRVALLLIVAALAGCSQATEATTTSPEAHSVGGGDVTVYVMTLDDGTPCAVAHGETFGRGVAISCDWAYIGRNAP